MSSDLDLADRLDDLICTFDDVLDAAGDVDTVLAVLLGWIVFAGILFLASHWLFQAGGGGSGSGGDAGSEDTNDAIRVDDGPQAGDKGQARPDEEAKQQTLQEGQPERGKITVRATIQTIPDVGSVKKRKPASALASAERGVLASSLTASETRDMRERGELAELPIPKSVGSDEESVAWVNTCLANVFKKDNEALGKIMRQWKNAMNEYIRSSAIDEGIRVDFVDFQNRKQIPSLDNMTTLSHPGDNMTVTADLDVTFCLVLRLTRLTVDDGSTESSSNLLLHVDRMRGRMNLAVLSRERLVVAKLDGWPEIRTRLTTCESEENGKVNAKAASLSASSDAEQRHLSDVVRDLAVSALRGAQVNINMEHFSESTFPVFKRSLASSTSSSGSSYSKGRKKPTSLSPPTSRTGSQRRNLPATSMQRQVSVCLVKASQMGTGADRCLQPYVVIEVDEPSQRFRSLVGMVDEETEEEKVEKVGSLKQATAEWNQECVFDLNARSSELLFEVWDAGRQVGANAGANGPSSDLFLGLGIVSVDELLITPAQRHVIPLQGRPFQDGDEHVNGLLTVQFVLIDHHSEMAPVNGVSKLREVRRARSPRGQIVVASQSVTFRASEAAEAAEAAEADDTQATDSPKQTTARIKAKLSRRGSYTRAMRSEFPEEEGTSPGLNSEANNDAVTLAALSDLKESKLTSNGPGIDTETSTMIIHGSKKTVAKKSSLPLSSSSLPPGSALEERRPLKAPDREINGAEGGSKNEVLLESLDITSVNSSRDSDVGSFTGAISGGVGGVFSDLPQRGRKKNKRNLVSTLRKRITAARSMSLTNHDKDSIRPISAEERARSLSELRAANTLPVPSPTADEDGASSMSDLSGISAASNKTYINEDSSLVLETVENGITKFYLIPHDVALKGKFRRKGTKLHIYMDHIFVAKHVKGGTMCCACNKSIPLRLGKQAYVCRDCSAVCHKPCHVLVGSHCLETSLPAMELECYNDSVIFVPQKKRRN